MNDGKTVPTETELGGGSTPACRWPVIIVEYPIDDAPAARLSPVLFVVRR